MGASRGWETKVPQQLELLKATSASLLASLSAARAARAVLSLHTLTCTLKKSMQALPPTHQRITWPAPPPAIHHPPQALPRNLPKARISFSHASPYHSKASSSKPSQLRINLSAALMHPPQPHPPLGNTPPSPPNHPLPAVQFQLYVPCLPTPTPHSNPPPTPPPTSNPSRTSATSPTPPSTTHSPSTTPRILFSPPSKSTPTLWHP